MSGDDDACDKQGSHEFSMDSIEVPSKTVAGIYVPVLFNDKFVADAVRFRPWDDNLVVATYPKCGTTWMQCIVCNLLYRDTFAEDGQMSSFLQLCPYIESFGTESLKPDSFYKIHLPFNAETFNPKTKYIVVLRNPRDVCVSYYHFYTNMYPGVPGLPKGFNWFPKFVEMFVSGRCWYGDYFEHVRGWLEDPCGPDGQKPDNILYVVYEKMKLDPQGELLRVANFIGGPAAELVKDKAVIEDILNRTTVESMKTKVNTAVADALRNKFKVDGYVPDQLELVRKGQVGDWKNYFTPELSALFDAWIQANPDNEKIMKLFDL